MNLFCGGHLLTRLAFWFVIAFFIKSLTGDSFIINGLDADVSETPSSSRTSTTLTLLSSGGGAFNETAAFEEEEEEEEEEDDDDDEDDEEDINTEEDNSGDSGSGEIDCVENCEGEDCPEDCINEVDAATSRIIQMNITEALLTDFINKTFQMESVDSIERWTDCFACYRLSTIVGPNPSDREVQVDTCRGGTNKKLMPKVRCHARWPANRLPSLVTDDANPACGKSYIKANTSELVIYGCYSPAIWSIRKNPPPGHRRRKSAAYGCRNGFGMKGKTLSVYMWCCEDDFCNAGTTLKKETATTTASFQLFLTFTSTIIISATTKVALN